MEPTAEGGGGGSKVSYMGISKAILLKSISLFLHDTLKHIYFII